MLSKQKIRLCMLFVAIFCSVSNKLWAVSIWEQELRLIRAPYSLLIRKTDHKTEKTGDILSIAMPVSVAIASTVYEGNSQGLVEFTQAFLVAQGTTAILKRVINKRRPNGYCCTSFPSGHASSAFASAAFTQARYESLWSAPMYLLSAYVGYSRVYAKKHYIEDVATGAAIGVGSAFLFTDSYKKGVLKNAKSKPFNNRWHLFLDNIQGHSVLSMERPF